MIHMCVQWCMVLDMPADQSPFYKAVCDLHGEEEANRWTYEQIIPPFSEMIRSGSDELKQVIEIVTNGHAPGRAL